MSRRGWIAAVTAPTNHHITIDFPGGRQARGRVVYLQPKAERWREQSAIVHIGAAITLIVVAMALGIVR